MSGILHCSYFRRSVSAPSCSWKYFAVGDYSLSDRPRKNLLRYSGSYHFRLRSTDQTGQGAPVDRTIFQDPEAYFVVDNGQRLRTKKRMRKGKTFKVKSSFK